MACRNRCLTHANDGPSSKVLVRNRNCRAALPVGGLATSLLILFGAAQSANAQSSADDDVKGTVCEAPADDSTRSACFVAMLDCAFVTVYGRTDEEKDRMYKSCIRKIVGRYKRASDATGNAVRREFSVGPEDRAAAKAAAQKKAQVEAAANAAFAEKQQAMQQHYDRDKQACLTGQGMLSVNGTLELEGRDPIFLYAGQVVQPVTDPNAATSGKCSVTLTRDGREFSGKIPIVDLDPPTIE